MMIVLLFFGIIHLILTAFLFLVGSKLHKAKEALVLVNGTKISLADVTVVIPFRNEEENLPQLVKCILASKRLPSSIVFIDDSSSDAGRKIIEDLITSKKEVGLRTSIGIGKKAAIRTGIELATTTYILTLDADVLFEEDYFSNLERLSADDLLILPVRMQGKGWKQLFEFDFTLSNYLNAAINGWKRPIMGSGANLLFKREVFLEVDSYATHKNIASGDDMFLLSDFRRNNKKIALVQNTLFEVLTAVPQTFQSFLHQRVRWIQKTPKVKDDLANALGLFAGIGSLMYLVIVVLTLFYNPKFTLWIVAVKLFFDLFLYDKVLLLPFDLRRLFFVILYLLIAPVYQIGVAVMAVFFKPSWKGRV